MKRIFAILLAALILSACLPALAEGAQLPTDDEDFIPYEVRRFFADPVFNGYTIRVGSSRYFENTVGGTFFFTVAQKEGYNVLYGFEEKNGKFNYFLKTDSAIPQGKGSFQVNQLYGEHNMVWFDDPVYIGDTLSLIFIREDYEEQADSGVWFEVNGSGQWNLTWAFFDYCWNGAKVENDAVTYYLDEGNVKSTVSGVVERNLRYFSWDAFPKTLKDAKEKLSTPPAIPTGELAAQRIKFEGGQKYPVYSGPGVQYERANNGKASVSTNDWIQVFGSENGYILIQYDITSAQMRFGWIEQSALPKGASAVPLRFAYTDASVSAAAFLTDDPLNSQSRVRALNAGQAVKWLAAMGSWVYVEITDGELPIRGFVPASAVSKAPVSRDYEASYQGEEYTALAQVTVTEDGHLSATVRIRGLIAWAEPDTITGYQLYANQTPLKVLPAVTESRERNEKVFAVQAVLPANTVLLGLCPVYAKRGLKAEEMLTVTLQSGRTVLTGLNRAVVNNPNPADRLHLRLRPDAASTSLGKYYNGTTVTLLPAEKEYEGFTCVQAGGMTGYMMTEYLAFGEAARRVADARPAVTVQNQAGTGLNLRAAPSLDGQLLTLLPNGAQVTVNGLTEEWLNVTAGDQTGWIKANGVTPQLSYNLYAGDGTSGRKAQIIADCSVHSSPESLPYDVGDSRSNIVTTAYAGSAVTVYQTQGGFAQIGKSPSRWVPLSAIRYLEDPN